MRCDIETISNNAYQWYGKEKKRELIPQTMKVDDYGVKSFDRAVSSRSKYNSWKQLSIMWRVGLARAPCEEREGYRPFWRRRRNHAVYYMQPSFLKAATHCDTRVGKSTV